MVGKSRRSRILRVLDGTLLAVALVVLVVIVVSIAIRPQTMRNVSPIDVSSFGRRVLVIVPHPDDEVLTAGGLIQQLLASGAQVRVVIVTAGDGYYSAARRLSPSPVTPASYRHLGDVRHQESLNAAAKLGLPASDLIELGFPDTGTPSLWDQDWSSDQSHVGRTGVARVPYSWAYDPSVPYSGEALNSLLTRIIGQYRPDTVVSPDTHETHPDHYGVATFTLLALDETGFTGRHLTTIVHYPWYPYPWEFAVHDMLEPPPSLTNDGSTWYSLSLSAAQMRLKRAALDQYHSQERVIGRAIPLRSFVRRNELFNERAAALLLRVPHDSIPASGTADVVTTMRYPGRTLARLSSVRIRSLRMDCGPHTTWIGIVCSRPLGAGDYCSVHLRLTGWKAVRRIDIAVSSNRAGVERVDSSSLTPSPVDANAVGSTMWISLPSDALTGYTHAIVGASAGQSGQPAFRTAWRDVEL